MKTGFFLPFFFLVLYIGGNAQEKVLTFDTIRVYKKILPHPNYQDTVPCATFDLMFVYPKTFEDNPDKLKALQEIFQDYFFKTKLKYYNREDKGKVYENPQAVVDDYVNKYTAEYIDYLSFIFEDVETSNLDDYSYNFLEELKDTIFYHNASVVSSRFSLYSYEGGSHGYFYICLLNLDLKTLKPITFSDVFVDNYTQELSEILYSKFIEQIAADRPGQSIETIKKYYSYLETAGEIVEFLITEKGLYFRYDPQMFPHMDEIFEVTISYSELKSILKPEFMKRYFSE